MKFCEKLIKFLSLKGNGKWELMKTEVDEEREREREV